MRERNKRVEALQKLPAVREKAVKGAEQEISLAAAKLGKEAGQIANQQELENELSKLFRSMHLMSERDLDATVTRVFRAMMRMGREGPVGSTELSKESGINRITVIHHLKRLETAGVVEKHESKYMLRVRSMEEMMEEMREDMLRQFEEMDQMARELDRAFMSDFGVLEHGKRGKREKKQ